MTINRAKFPLGTVPSHLMCFPGDGQGLEVLPPYVPHRDCMHLFTAEIPGGDGESGQEETQEFHILTSLTLVKSFL